MKQVIEEIIVGTTVVILTLIISMIIGRRSLEGGGLVGVDVSMFLSYHTKGKHHEQLSNVQHRNSSSSVST